jgi:hypothetical protein
MSLEQLNMKHRTYRRASAKSAIEKLSSVERIKGIAIELEQAKCMLKTLQGSEQQLIVQLGLLMATRQLELYELYTAERMRLAGAISDAEVQVENLCQQYEAELEVAARYSRKERKTSEMASKTDSIRRVLMEELRLGDFLMHEASRRV